MILIYFLRVQFSLSYCFTSYIAKDIIRFTSRALTFSYKKLSCDILGFILSGSGTGTGTGTGNVPHPIRLCPIYIIVFMPYSQPRHTATTLYLPIAQESDDGLIVWADYTHSG